uniref:Cytochrome P450 4F4-like n=1 Tax=Phallusia mammillata TaxID=59560 RepID=A0A6F9DBA5_9ASCI|nr:cytochrome P450 4F4-like [Phallusia mammillata]
MEAKAKVLNESQLDEILESVFMILWTCFAIFLIYFIFGFAKRLWRFYLIRKNLREEWKGPKGHWFWGHLGMVTKGNKDPKNFIKFFTEKEKLYDVGFTIYKGPFDAVLMLYDPNIVKKVLSLTAFEAPKRNLKALLPWLGKGVFLLNGWEWYRHRKLLTSAFHFEALKPYARIMNKCAKTLVAKWEQQTADKEVYNVEIFEQSSLFTLDTILQCLMDHRSNCQEQSSENSYIASIYKLSKLVINRMRSKNLFDRFSSYYYRTDEGKDFQNACDVVHQMSEKMIEIREQSPQEGVRGHRDFLDMLLMAKDDDGKGLTKKEIRAEVDTFLFGGHDTTASAITWTLHCLSINPEHQELCHNEIVSVIGDGDIRWSDLSQLQHLTRCIKESLRIFPPAPLISRKLNKDIHFEGRKILKGTTVQLSIIGVQRNENFWDNPQEFRPDRFTLDNSAKQNIHAFIPFSAGPRNCIGQHFAMNEVKIVLAHILRRFKFTPDGSREINYCHEIIYRARGGLYLNIHKRS